MPKSGTASLGNYFKEGGRENLTAIPGEAGRQTVLRSQPCHVGSTNASLLGLYQYTTQTNQTKEGTNIVTIGYHYVAADTNGLPDDTTGTGIADYLKDANGNGLVDSGEINWTNAADIGLTVIITRPVNNSAIP